MLLPFPSWCSWVSLITAGELLWRCYCGREGKDCHPGYVLLHQGDMSPRPVSMLGGCFFEKLQIKKAPDHRTYSLVSKHAESFCSHSKKMQVCPVYRCWLFFRSCKDFASGLNTSDAKLAVGDRDTPTSGEHEVC